MRFLLRREWLGALTGLVVLLPPIHARFSYQIGGGFPPRAGVSVVERDRSERPARRVYGVCYVNAFQAQTQERGWWLQHHHSLLLFRGRRAVIDTGWNEQLLDTSTAGKRAALARIVGAWMAGCAHAGYRAVEPDNLDSYSRSQGLLTARENLAFASLLITRAHALGLAIAQKNAPELAAQGRRLGFDFSVAEECQVYAECSSFTRAYGNQVSEIEYLDNGGTAGFRAACRARGSRISITLRDRNAFPAGQPGYLESWCP